MSKRHANALSRFTSNIGGTCFNDLYFVSVEQGNDPRAQQKEEKSSTNIAKEDNKHKTKIKSKLCQGSTQSKTKSNTRQYKVQRQVYFFCCDVFDVFFCVFKTPKDTTSVQQF